MTKMDHGKYAHCQLRKPIVYEWVCETKYDECLLFRFLARKRKSEKKSVVQRLYQ